MKCYTGINVNNFDGSTFNRKQTLQQQQDYRKQSKTQVINNTLGNWGGAIFCCFYLFQGKIFSIKD